LNETGQGSNAFLFHPNLGNEVVAGTLFVDRSGLRFQSETVSEEIPVQRVAAEWDAAGERICFKDTARPELTIYTTDQALLEHPAFPQLNQARDTLNDDAGRRELSRRVRLTLYFFAGCLVLVWAGSRATSVMVRSLAERVPPDWERRFGSAQVAEWRGEMELADYSNQVAQLTALAAPLLRVLPPGHTEAKFFIVDDPTPNACALPGGFVMVNTGLIKLTDRPEELLGVLAHELAHVTQKHHVRKLISAAGPLVIFGVFLHSRDRLLNTVSQGSGVMVYQGFSKEYETEADDVGWESLVAAKIDPRGMTSVFRKLKAFEEKQKIGAALPQAFRSHPALDKRIARLESKWRKLPDKTGFLELTNPVPSVAPRIP